AYGFPASGALDIVVQRIHAAVKKAQTRHHNRSIVFCLPEMPAREFVQVMAQMAAEQEQEEPLDLANTLPDAVARLIQRNQERTAARPQFALDALVGVDAHGADLRDNETGRLNAAKVRELFGLKMTDLAKAAGIS